MDSIIGIIQKIVAQEMRKIYTTELGVVTAVFPHASDSDKDNYQCSVKLKNRKQSDGSDFELRKVPVATGHIGLANIPNVGDLVLLTFINGDLNGPVITGRLYNDEDQPPINQTGEFLLQHTLEKGGSLKMDADGVITLSSQEEKSVVTIQDDLITLANQEDKSVVTVKEDMVTLTTSNGQISIKMESGGITIDAGSNNVTVKSMGNITVGDATTGQVKVGGRMLSNAVGDNDDIILSMHTHVGNLGAPCPIMVPTEKINSIQAKGRNTQVG